MTKDSQITEFDRMKTHKDAITQRPKDLLELARIKCTRRWQGEDYPMNETGLGIAATAHLREILALIEEAQKYV